MAKLGIKSNVGVDAVNMENLSLWYAQAQTSGASPYKSLLILKEVTDPYAGSIRLTSQSGVSISNNGAWSGIITGVEVVDPSAGVSINISELSISASSLQTALKSGETFNAYKTLLLGGNDVLNGTSSNDYLWGFDGNDTLYGGAGNDYIRGGAGDDTVYGQAGDDSYRVWLGMEDDGSLRGGNDTIIEDGNSSADRLRVYGDGGLYSTAEWSGSNFKISGYDANGILKQTTVVKNQNVAKNKVEFIDIVDDQYDEVTATYLNSTALVGGDNNDFIVGTTNNETLNGANGNDFLMAGSGNDLVKGGFGDDKLDGGWGNDTLNGEAGNDIYIIGGAFVGNDVIQDTAGDEDIFQLKTDFLDGVGINVQRGGASNTDLVFDFYKNNIKIQTTTIKNQYNGNRIEYFEGSDRSFAMSGALIDVNGKLVGTNMWEFIAGSSNNNLIQAGGGDDAVFGGSGNDTLYGGWGDDYLNAGFGTDTINGDSGNDNLDGTLSSATMFGGVGDDAYEVDSADDVVIEKANEGFDLVTSGLSSYTLTANVEKLTLGGSGNSEGKGNNLNNWIGGNLGANKLYGFVGNDTLNGGLGADTMEGGLGDDQYNVDNTNDVVVEKVGEGKDTVYATRSYTLAANVENINLGGAEALNATGNELNNNIFGNSANNIINGLAGDDWINGLGGDDIMSGGTGSDSYTVDSSLDVINEGFNEGDWDTVYASITFTLAANIEKIYLQGVDSISATGNASNNNMNGNSGNNILNGLAGDDWFYGNGGADTMTGGMGNDNYSVDSSDDIVFENPNEGNWDTVHSSISYILGSNVENLNLQGSTTINGTGNGANNNLNGNVADNVLMGLGGDDWINGQEGKDTMIGGLGNDSYNVDNAADLVTEKANEGTWDTVNSSITYTLGINLENLNLVGDSAISGTGNTANNSINGNQANNVLVGLAGDDWINGQGGSDTMYGGAGNDSFTVDNAQDLVVENVNEGKWDSVNAQISYTLTANVENLNLVNEFGNINGVGNELNNSLSGNEGSNQLKGMAGADNINGNDGNDSLIGGAGNDYLTGGDGNDSFVFESALNSLNNRDTISDFTVGADKIVLENAVFTKLTKLGVLAAGNFSKTGVAADANDYVIFDVNDKTLAYDADGNGSGLKVVFAILDFVGVDIANTDFLII